MESGIDSILGGNLSEGLSTMILPPFGRGKSNNFGPNAAAIVAKRVRKGHKTMKSGLLLVKERVKEMNELEKEETHLHQ